MKIYQLFFNLIPSYITNQINYNFNEIRKDFIVLKFNISNVLEYFTNKIIKSYNIYFCHI